MVMSFCATEQQVRPGHADARHVMLACERSESVYPDGRDGRSGTLMQGRAYFAMPTWTELAVIWGRKRTSQRLLHKRATVWSGCE